MDWTQLEHAYGSAGDLPGLFDKVRGGSTAALDALANRIAHQGWASPEVALAAVPTLFELVDVTSGKTRAALLVLLADLACAGSHQHFLGSRFASDGGAQAILRAAPVAALRAGVVARAAQAGDLLSDKSAPVRGAAALLLAVTEQDPTPLITRLAKEKNAQARADVLMALGWLQAAPELVERDSAHADSTVRAGALVARAYRAPLNAAVRRGLLDALTLEPVKGSAWAQGDVARHVTSVLQWHASTSGDTSLLADAFDAVDDNLRTSLGGSMVKSVFAAEIAALGSGPAALSAANAAQPPPLSSLSPAQRDTLALLARYDSGWGGSSDQRFWLAKLGFRTSPPAMRRYLGDDPPPTTLLDQTVVHWDGRDVSLRDVLPLVCVPDQPELTKQAALAIAPQVGPARAVEAVRLINECDTLPCFFARYAFGLHLLVAQGPAVAAALAGALETVARDGNPGFWNARDQKSINSHFASQCAAALHVVQHGRRVPPGALNEVVRLSAETILSRSSAEVVDLVRAGLDAATVTTG